MHLCDAIESLQDMASRQRRDDHQVAGEVVKYERRAFRRTTVDRFMTRLMVESGSSFDCKVLNLSSGGAAVEVEIRPPVGQKCCLAEQKGGLYATPRPASE